MTLTEATPSSPWVSRPKSWSVGASQRIIRARRLTTAAAGQVSLWGSACLDRKAHGGKRQRISSAVLPGGGSSQQAFVGTVHSCGCRIGSAVAVLLMGRLQSRLARRANQAAHAKQCNDASRNWSSWWKLPIHPYQRRCTVLQELVPGEVWGLDQVQGILYVHVPVRMILVRLRSPQAEGLLVYAPVAPTEECLDLVQSVEAIAGPVRVIVLSTTATEHKVFAGEFAAARPDAQFVAVPDQFSFPVDLPLELLGFPRFSYLPRESPVLPESLGAWVHEFESVLLGPLRSRDNTYEELVLFHRRTQTVLCTDLLQTVPADPPAVLMSDDPQHSALLYHARDTALDVVADDVAARQRGWQRIALFALYFQPASLLVKNEPDGTLLGALRFFSGALSDALASPMAGKIGPLGGFFPFEWQPAWQEAFDTLRRNGEPLAPPILALTILDREPKELQRVLEVMASWPSERLVACHFGALGPCSPELICTALALGPVQGNGLRLPSADLHFLRGFAKTLELSGAIPARRD